MPCDVTFETYLSSLLFPLVLSARPFYDELPRNASCAGFRVLCLVFIAMDVCLGADML